MATFSISAVARKAQATANGSTTEFAFSFSVNTEADVAVFVGTTLKTISTHYTVSITSSTGAGSITFTSGNTPTNGQIVTIMSKTALARSSVYTSGGTINATSLETDFDTNMMLFQQQDERLDRVITAPVDDATSIDMTLPNKDARKGTVLGFNATSGNPEAGPSITAVQSLADVTTAINLLGTSDAVSDMNTLGTSSNVTNQNTLAGISSNITTVAGIASDVTAVAGDATDIGVVAGKATEIGRLGTSDAVADMAILGTSDVVADMNTLGTAAIVEDMNLLGTSANVTAMGLLGNSAVIADMAILGTTDVVADMAILATTDVVADMNTLATSDIISDLNTLATSDIVTDMNLLATSSNVAAMGLLGTSDVVADMALLGTSDVVADMAILGTTDVVADMNTLATSDIVSDMNTLATSANVTAMGLLGTSAVVEDMGFLGTAAVVEDMGILGTSANVTAMSNVSGSISNVNTVATNLSGITAFSAVYSSGSSDPSSNLNAGDLFFNTSSDTLKVYTGSAWEQGVTAGSGFLPLSGGTMTGNLALGDNVKATFGAGSDLLIYHDGSNSYITDNGAGQLYIGAYENPSTDYAVKIGNVANNEIYAGFNNATSVDLFFNNSKKFETTATGVDVTGNIVVSGTVDGVDLQTLNTAVTANTAKTTNATHTGEVTGSGALTIADNVVDEANLKVSNSPVNGYMLTAQSGNTGGLTWAEAGGGTPAIVFPSNWASPTNNYTSSGTWSKGSLADDDYVWFYLVNSGGGGGNQRPGYGGMAMLLYGTAAAFNGASYTIGAEKAGQNDNHGTIQNPTTVTLSSSNGSLAFTPKEISDADDTSGVSTLQTNIRSIHAGVADAYLIGSPAASYSIKTGTLPTNYGKWTVSNGYQTYSGYDGDCVFGGGVGYTTIGSANASAVSLFAGNGGSSLGAAPAAPGGGGAQGDGTTGATGAAGSLRVYHV